MQFVRSLLLAVRILGGPGRRGGVLVGVYKWRWGEPRADARQSAAPTQNTTRMHSPTIPESIHTFINQLYTIPQQQQHGIGCETAKQICR